MAKNSDAKLIGEGLLKGFYETLTARGVITEEERRQAIFDFMRGCLKASAEASRLCGLTWIDHVSAAGCEGHRARTSVSEAESKMHILLHLLSHAFPDGDFPAPDLPMGVQEHDHIPASELN